MRSYILLILLHVLFLLDEEVLGDQEGGTNNFGVKGANDLHEPFHIQEECTEMPYDNFFVGFKDDTTIKIKNCSWLQELDVESQKFMCNKSLSHNGIGPAEEVCMVTCNTCSSNSNFKITSSSTRRTDNLLDGCFEDPDALFFSRMGANGPIMQPCLWLLTRSTEQIDWNCSSEDSSGEYGPAMDVCPISCGICSTITPSMPSSAPSVTNSFSATPSLSYLPCDEDPNELFFNRMGENGPIFQPCSWLQTRTTDQIDWNCSLEDSHNGYGPAMESCPISCGTCNVLGQPSTAPPPFPYSPSSTPSTPQVCYEESDELFFNRIGANGPIFQPCSWIVTRTTQQIDWICSQQNSYDQYGPAMEVCPISCNICVMNSELPSNTPTTSLSSIPSSVPTMVDSIDLSNNPTITPIYSNSYDIGCIYPPTLGNDPVSSRYFLASFLTANVIDLPDGVQTKPFIARMGLYVTGCTALCLAYHHPNIMDPFMMMPTFMTVPPFGQNAYSTTMCQTQCWLYVWEDYYDALPIAIEYFNSLGLSVTNPSERPDIEAAILELITSQSTEAIMTILENEGYHPFTVGHIAGVQVMHRMASDGFNSKGDMRWNPTLHQAVPCTANCRPFQDTTGYQPVPNPRIYTFLSFDSSKYNCTGYCRHWQPEENNGAPTGSITRKIYTMPHIGTKVEPYLRNTTSTLEDPNYDYYEESLHVVERLRETSSNDTKKLLINLFRGDPIKGIHGLRGPLQSLMKNQFKDQINFVDHMLFFYGLSLIEHDSIIHVWKEKVAHDLVRPSTVIKQWGEDQLNTFGGNSELNEAETICASDFETFLPPIDSTAEFPSTRSCFCTTLMEFIDLYLEDTYGDTLRDFTIKVNGFDLIFRNMEDYRNQCGESMLWGGFNYPASIVAGEELCSGLGELGVQYIKDLNVGSNDMDGWWKPGDVVPDCPSSSPL